MSASMSHPLRTVSLLFSADPRIDGLSLLIGLRWVAILGQLSAVAVATAALGFELPLAPLLATIGALAAFALAGALPMLAVQRLFGQAGWLRRWERAGHRAIGAAICALAGWGVAMTLSGNAQGLFCLPAG